MGRKKLDVKRIENPAVRQLVYEKRKTGIVKKANELSILCGANVALLLLPPSDACITDFASPGKTVEDILLTFVEMPDSQRGGPIKHKEFLSRRLKELMVEREMLEKMTIFQDHEKILKKLRETLAQAVMRYSHYAPDLKNTHIVTEAQYHEQNLQSAIENLQLLKAKFLESQLLIPKTNNNTEMNESMIISKDAPLVNDQNFRDMNQYRVLSSIKVEDGSGTSLSMDPFLNHSFFEAKEQWGWDDREFHSLPSNLDCDAKNI